MAKIVHTCTGCIPIDASIIESYVALVNTNKAVAAAEDERQEAEGQGDYSDTATYPDTRRAKEAERQAAESERERRAGEDHTTAASDHERAGEDHTTAASDHERAGEDHTTAASDHERAGEDHTASDLATERANEAAAAAEHMVDIKQGPKGEQGNTGASVDYPYELVNNLTTDDATKGLSAAQGVVLDSKISQLGQEIDKRCVYDISAKNIVNNAVAVYASLTDALGTNGANLPAEVRHGGMEIRFVLNKGTQVSPILEYVQYRFLATEVANADIVNLNNWAVYPKSIEVESPEFIEVHTDADGKVLYGTRLNGDFYFAAGVPSQIERAISNAVDEIDAKKLDKEAGKVLIPEQYVQEEQSEEYLYVVKDAVGKLLEALKENGAKVIYGDQQVIGNAYFDNDVKILGKTVLWGSEVYFADSPEWLMCILDGKQRILCGIRRDATFFVHDVQVPSIDAMRALIADNASYHRLHIHGPAMFFIDDDGGQYFPDTWGVIMQQTGIRVGIACIAGYMSGEVPVSPTNPGYIQMSLEQLRGYYEAGVEVYSHSWSHPSFRNDVTLESLDVECRKAKDWLIANGFTRNADAIVYPGGMDTSDSSIKKNVVRRYYRYGVATVDSYNGVNRAPLDELFISRCNGDTGTLEELKARVDVAVAENKILGIMTHAYQLTGRGAVSTTTEQSIEKLVALIEYANSKGVNVRPMEEIIHEIYGWDFRSNIF